MLINDISERRNAFEYVNSNKGAGKTILKKVYTNRRSHFQLYLYKVIVLNDHPFIHAPDKKSYCT